MTALLNEHQALSDPTRRTMFSIGEFSKITGLTIKTLRFYHEQQVLPPSYIDPQTGYRYYAAGKVETARIIAKLRQLEFSLAEIAEILSSYDDDADILDFLKQRSQDVAQQLKHYSNIQKTLQQIVTQEQEARQAMNANAFEVEQKQVPPMLIAGVRMKAAYDQCGKGFSKIGRRFGRYICGKPFLLHYDDQYQEVADFEACMPIKKGTATDEISVRELPGGTCLSLLHKGPYEEIGRSYAKIGEYAKSQGYDVQLPTREIYLKGPGMIFKGNPKKYLTEIQMLVREAER